MKFKKWIYQHPDQNKIEEISHMFDISPIAAAVIYNRGIQQADDIKVFLEKNVSDFHDPFLMKDMDKAVKRIEEAIIQHENVTVYGDYDVDGVTSTALLVKYLRSRGLNAEYYIPDRMDEGYGINKSALERIRQNGTSLLITVDSGITAAEEIRYAQQLGLNVIVTDHHECKGDIPECSAVLNPKQSDCSYPFKELAGVGVAFKLIQALEGKDNAQTIVDTYSDMVCLGTIADVVPLLGENRLIVSAGLQKMSNINTSNMGLQALIKISALKEKKITAGMVGFIVAPRINAAGRIGSALRAVELFLTESEIVADEISAELNEENRNRQAEEAQILQEALKLVEDLNLSQRKVIVLSGENWHHGVIGIVASRITDKFYRPSILISLEGNEGKGSGRSISGFNLFKALNVCEEDLIKFGGHELAAGLSIEKQKIADFNEHIIKYAEQNLNEDDLIPRIKIDYEINVESLKIDTIKQIEVLAPFGMGNASPIFCFSHADITDIKTVGDNKHLKIRLEKDGCSIDAIGFNMGEYGQHFINGDVVDIACSLDVNSYNGNEKVQLIIKDIKLTDDQIKEYEYFKHLYSYINEKPQCDFSKFQWSEQIFNSVIPKRQDFIIVYQYIKTRSLNDTYSDNEFLLHRRIAKSYNVPMNFLKVKNCLDVFQELGLLDYSICDEKITIYLYDNKGEKVNIESSRKLVNLKKMKERLIQ